MKRATYVTLPLLCISFLLGCPEPTVNNDEARQQTEAATDAYVEMWNTGEMTALDTLIAAGYERHFADTTISGREGLQNNIMQNHNAFSDLNVRIDEVLFDGNLSAARFVFTGTHDGPFGAIPASRLWTGVLNRSSSNSMPSAARKSKSGR